MIRSISIIAALFITQNLFGQINLVPNPSFEDTLPHNGCITGIEIANPWFNPNAATPDLFTYKPSCNNSSLNNLSGFQLPRTGMAYAGIYGYLNPTREYLAIKLDSALLYGCNYYVQFYVSLANEFGLACDKIGISFTDDTSGFKSIPGALPLQPVIQSPPGLLISDTTDWTEISGYFTADGTEQFLIIGNFYDDANTYWDTVNINAQVLWAYYYVDDVILIPCLSGTSENMQFNEINLFPNPAQNHIVLEFSTLQRVKIIQLMDFTGRIVYKTNISANIKKWKINTENFDSGFYFLNILLYNNKKFTKTISIIH